MVSVISKESIHPTSRGLDRAVSNDSLCFLIWMGRVKLKIKRLESRTSRLTTYSKRKNGLIKKANELSVLCDIDVVLLLFSPSGRPVLWKGMNSSIEGIIERFAELTPQERAKRKLEIFDALKRSYRKSDHKVNVQDFFGSSCSYQAIGDLTIQANLLRNQLSEVHKRLSDWNNPDKIDSIELLKHMEFYIKELIDQIRTQKENIGKQHFTALGCTNQFQNGMHLPFSLGVEQQVQFFSWIQNDDNQHMVSPTDPKLHPKRETELSAGNSFGNCSGYFGTVEKAEIASPGPESGVLNELLRTESLRNELIGLKSETCNELTKTESLKNELIKTESLRNELVKTEFLTNELMKSECLRNELIRAESLWNELIKTNSLRNELIESESLKLQLYEQYSYPQYHFSILPDKKRQPEQQMNLQQTVDNYCAQGNLEPRQSGYDFTHCNWASTSGPSFIAPFDEHLYPQQHHSPSGHAAEELGPLYAKASHQLNPRN